MVNPVAWYEANAAAVSAQYENVSAHAVHGWLLDLLPSCGRQSSTSAPAAGA